jgi:hypothetical protein
MRNHEMTSLPQPNWSDDQIVECVRHWSLGSTKCGLDGHRYNKINFKYFVPCADMLKTRGPSSLAKLLPLLDDESPDVRLTAASIAYEADTVRCRNVLLDLMKTPDRVGVVAWGSLAALDPKNAPKPTELWSDRL